MAAEKQNEKKKKKKKIDRFEIMTRCSGESLFHPTDLHWCVFFFFLCFQSYHWVMSAGEKYEKSTKTHTQQQHERRGGGKPTLRRMRQLISFRVNGEAGKGKKKKGLIKRLQCFYWQCVISCFKCPIKGTEIGSLALAACAPESLEGERPTSLRVKLLVEKPRKKKKKRWFLSSLTPQGRKIPAWPQSDENYKYDGSWGF